MKIGLAVPGWMARALFEAALIVFAVVLGFVVNEWRETVDAERRADAALSRIVEEMTANRDALERVVGYHEQVSASLAGVAQALHDGEGEADGRLFETVGPIMPLGIQEPRLSHVVWSQASGQDVLANAEFGLIARIAGVYSMQESGVEATWRAVANTFFANADSYRTQELEPHLTFMSVAFGELASQERYLISEYEAAIPIVVAAGEK
ncbi:hypothetical protein [Maricaulis sp.]|uniref:hypothetical protein n=1 Tax=Maricaulis sp. TaxID=1486257 RepID=UPI003A955E72